MEGSACSFHLLIVVEVVHRELRTGGEDGEYVASGTFNNLLSMRGVTSGVVTMFYEATRKSDCNCTSTSNCSTHTTTS